jgi:hypothetical protein
VSASICLQTFTNDQGKAIYFSFLLYENISEKRRKKMISFTQAVSNVIASKPMSSPQASGPKMNVLHQDTITFKGTPKSKEALCATNAQTGMAQLFEAKNLEELRAGLEKFKDDPNALADLLLTKTQDGKNPVDYLHNKAEAEPKGLNNGDPHASNFVNALKVLNPVNLIKMNASLKSLEKFRPMAFELENVTRELIDNPKLSGEKSKALLDAYNDNSSVVGGWSKHSSPERMKEMRQAWSETYRNS